MAYTTIDDPSAHFQTALYTGNETARTITNDGNSDLQPDFIWNKGRDHAHYHYLTDTTRGLTKYQYSNANNAEETFSVYVTNTTSDGFTLGNGQGMNDNTNVGGGVDYVTWQWKANGGTTTSVSASGSGITDILASTHQANTTAGFSIVSWTSVDSEAFVSHGLGAIPHVVLMKDRESTGNWIMYHVSVGSAHAMLLNLDGAKDGSSFFRDSDLATTGIPTSSIFKLGTQDHTGGHTNDMIAYCFAPIQGYSKFASWIGNGNADGPFVYTGFKPAWLLWKRSSAASDWFIVDNKRDTFNETDVGVNPNLDVVESIGNGNNGVDFLSNGFKVRQDNSGVNADGSTYIYMAFAENPFVTSTGIPATAR